MAGHTTAAKKADMKQDARAMKGMKPAQKAAFKKADMASDKGKSSVKADAKQDAALRKKIMAKKGK